MAWTDWLSANKDWLIPAAQAGVGAYGAYSQSKGAREDRDLRREESLADREARRQGLALDESALNPFRHQLDQAQSLAMLDLMARAEYSPTQISVPGVKSPQISGGFNYEPNPDLREAAQRLQGDIASGRGAPTMTDPRNFGQTGAMNLNTPGAPGAAPMASPAGGGMGGPTRARAAVPGGGMSAPGPASMAAPGGGAPGGGASGGVPGGGMDPNDPFLASVLAAPRRGGTGGGGGARGAAMGALSGAGSGASLGATVGAIGGPVGMGIGAGVGALAGLMGKQAKTAPTDIEMETARQLVADALQTYAGREPSPGEVDQILTGQGTKPSDRFVGEEGLLTVIEAIARNARQSAPRQPPEMTSARALFG